MLHSQKLLIGRLARDLEPVCRLVSPGRQLLLWLASVAAVASTLALACDRATVLQQFARSNEICLGTVGSMLTALLGATAALALSRPDRRASWALLPVPAATLWIVSGAINCVRHEALAVGDAGLSVTTNACIYYILAAATPLSMMLMGLLRCGYSLRPNSTSALCGLASAAAATTIGNVIHPHEAGVSHVALHGLVVGMIVFSNRVLGHWLLEPEESATSP